MMHDIDNQVVDFICFYLCTVKSQKSERLDLDKKLLDKINSILHKSDLGLLAHHNVIDQVRKLKSVESIQYDIISNEDFMEFSRLEIIFKKNT